MKCTTGVQVFIVFKVISDRKFFRDFDKKITIKTFNGTYLVGLTFLLVNRLSRCSIDTA